MLAYSAGKLSKFFPACKTLGIHLFAGECLATGFGWPGRKRPTGKIFPAIRPGAATLHPKS